jgi:hypothetical protein
MPISGAKARLTERLTEVVVSTAEPNFEATWQVFKAFAGEPVASASDGLLFQTGIHRFSGPERFTVSFLRQFESLDIDGDHESCDQLACEFFYEATDASTMRVSSSLWCFPSKGDSVSDWYEAVERRTEFRLAARLTPVSATIFQEQV